MGRAVVVKKDEKVKAVLEALGDEITEEAFVEKFKELYPLDWQNIQAVYKKEERNTKPGKTHPMPKPDIYMRNMYNNAKKKFG